MMNTTMITNSTKKMFLSVLTITIFSAAAFGQGILFEGVSHAIKSLKADKQQNELIFTAGYGDTNTADLNSFTLFNRKAEALEEVKVLKSFHVTAFDLQMEEELESESWMSTALTENLESTVVVEEWMTAPIQTEASVETEDWMTTSLDESVESNVIVEEWMTAPIQTEASVETEDWMTTSLSESLESDVNTEDWMTKPLI